MKKVKKVVSLFVAMSLLLSLLVGSSATAFAEEIYVPLKIISLPEFAIGANIAEANVEYEAIEGVTVETEWQIRDEDRDEYTKWFRVTEGVFESDRIYSLRINVVDPEGTRFNGQFVYNGETYDGWYGETEEGVWICFHEFGRYSDTTEITKVSIKASVPEVGAIATVDEVLLYDAKGKMVSPAAVTGGVNWQAMSKGDGVNVTGEAFEAEDVYFLVSDFAATSGYSFPEPMTFVINGEEKEVFADPKSAVDWQIYSLLSPLESLEVTGLPEAKAGEEMPADVKWDVEDATVTVNWLDEDGNVTEDTTFVAGKTYKLSLAVAMGYQPLAEDFVFVVDGKSYEPTSFEAEYNTAEVIIDYQIAGDGTGVDKAEQAPETGDSGMAMGWALLALAATASMVFVRKREM